MGHGRAYGWCLGRSGVLCLAVAVAGSFWSLARTGLGAAHLATFLGHRCHAYLGGYGSVCVVWGDNRLVPWLQSSLL